MNEIFRERFDSLWGRWASVVWHREELHRTLEMIREDQRLRYAQSTFVGDLRVWYADHVGVAIQAVAALTIFSGVFAAIAMRTKSLPEVAR